MKHIIFATGNSRKITEATSTLEPLGVTIESHAIDIDEIQHHDPAEITKAKARAAYEVIHKPVVVQDTNWSIPALGGFPGGYMKDVAEWFAPEDWLTLMARHEDRTIYCHEHVVYFDGEHLEHFSHTYTGTFAPEARGTSGNSLDKTVCLYDNLTLSEMVDARSVASAGEVLEHWKLFGEWYAGRP